MTIHYHLYSWQGINHKNTIITGELLAVSINHLTYKLQQQNIELLKAQKTSSIFNISSYYKKISKQDMAYLFRQLATLLSSGITLSRSLEIIGKNKKNSFKKLVCNIQQDIFSGESLGSSLQKNKSDFDHLTLNLIIIGEQTGQLDLILYKVADYYEKKIKIEKKMKQILFYPTFVLIVAAVIIFLMLLFIVPKFEELYVNFNQQLPFLTRTILYVSKLLRNNFFTLFFFLGLSSYLLAYGAKKIRFNSKFLPKNFFLEQFFFQLKISFAAGIPLAEILNILLKLYQPEFFQKKISNIYQTILLGEQFHQALLVDNFFPSYSVELIKVGEESGKLEEMLQKIHEICQEEMDNLLIKFSLLAEPLIMIVLGVLIGGLVIAMYLPIFKLGTVA